MQPGFEMFFLLLWMETLYFLLLLSFAETTLQTNCFTHIFVIKCTDIISNGSFRNTSPFLITKTFQSIPSDVCTIKNLHSSDLLVEASSANRLQLHSNCKEIGSFSVSVRLHPTLNTIHGVISEPKFSYSAKVELL